jgi:hypothetical protein
MQSQSRVGLHKKDPAGHISPHELAKRLGTVCGMYASQKDRVGHHWGEQELHDRTLSRDLEDGRGVPHSTGTHEGLRTFVRWEREKMGGGRGSTTAG